MAREKIGPYVVFVGKVRDLRLVHYIRTKMSSGFYIDDAGKLVPWKGLTWEILFSIEDNHLYKSGFIKILQSGKLQTHCLRSEMLSSKVAANKRKQFLRVEISAERVNEAALKGIVLKLAE